MKTAQQFADEIAVALRGISPGGLAGSDVPHINALGASFASRDVARPPLMPKPPEAVGAANKWQAMVDVDLLKIAFPNNTREELAKWVEPTRVAMIRWGIDLPREIASFLGNIHVESAGLTRLTESLNYSTEALISKFGRHRISVADAQRYGRNSQHPADEVALANILYGGTFGREQLGNTQPGDGSRHKGYGPKQITGRENQQRFGDAMGIPLEQVPDFLRTREGGMMGAGWFWKDKGMDALAATPGVEDDRRRVNGGTFGLAEVDAAFDRILEELLRRERTTS